MQTQLPGREVVVPEPGVIRSWAVRGGSGVVSLQVIRTNPKGRGLVVGFSQPEALAGVEPQQFAADVGVKPGDRIGIHLDPGASIGARATTDAAVTKWDGVLTAESRPSDGEIAGTELMLRADVEYGIEPTAPEQVVGPAAARAPRGRLVSPNPMTLPVRNGVDVIVVEVDGAIAIDVLEGVRLARIAVPDADADGRLVDLTQGCGPVVPGGFCLRWSNPGQPFPLEHQYVVRRDGHVKFVG
jgi:hypothetical protein